jgi:hypothetical protein
VWVVIADHVTDRQRRLLAAGLPAHHLAAPANSHAPASTARDWPASLSA